MLARLVVVNSLRAVGYALVMWMNVVIKDTIACVCGGLVVPIPSKSYNREQRFVTSAMPVKGARDMLIGPKRM